MPQPQPSPPTDPLENNPYITRTDIADLRDAIRAAAVQSKQYTAQQVDSAHRLEMSIDRLTYAVNQLEGTLREVTSVTQDTTALNATTTESDDPKVERRRKAR